MKGSEEGVRGFFRSKDQLHFELSEGRLFGLAGDVTDWACVSFALASGRGRLRLELLLS